MIIRDIRQFIGYCLIPLYPFVHYVIKTWIRSICIFFLWIRFFKIFFSNQYLLFSFYYLFNNLLFVVTSFLYFTFCNLWTLIFNSSFFSSFNDVFPPPYFNHFKHQIEDVNDKLDFNSFFTPSFNFLSSFHFLSENILSHLKMN